MDDPTRIAAITHVLTAPETRRRLLGFLAALPVVGGLFGILDADDAEGKGRRKRRKKAHKHGKGRRRKHRKKKCKPEPTAQTCAGRCGNAANNCRQAVDCGSCACAASCDSCSTCDTATQTCVTQCAAAEACCPGGCVDLESDQRNCGACGTACEDDEICVQGACTPCNVTCSGSPGDCGDTLRAALSGIAPTLYVCPGTYSGGFTVVRLVTIIGAGQGSAPASNTVLDGTGTGRVLNIQPGASAVTLERLHLRKGDAAGHGGGIFFAGPHLTARDCTVTENRAIQGGGVYSAGSGVLEMIRCAVHDNVAWNGGGAHVQGPATFTDCQITGNELEVEGPGGGITAEYGDQLILAGKTIVTGNKATEGGGLYVFNTPTTIGEFCQITKNTATVGGGGILNVESAVTLEGSGDTSPIVTNNCPDNCSGALVARCASGGSCPP